MIITPADRFIRLRLYSGCTLQEVQSQAFITLRVPWYQPGNAYRERVGEGTPSVEQLGTVYTGLPTTHSKKVKAKLKPHDLVLTPDSHLDPESYAKKYDFHKYLAGKGSVLAATAAMMWSNQDIRLNLCAMKLKGSSLIETTASLNTKMGTQYKSEELQAFYNLFWDSSNFSPTEFLDLIAGSPQVASVPKIVRESDDEIRRKLGLVSREENALSQIRFIKDYAFDAIELARLSDPRGVSRLLPSLASLYFETMREEKIAKEAQEMHDRLAEDTEDNRISIVRELAVPQFEELHFKKVEAAQRREELEFARKEGIIDDDYFDGMIARLNADESIGDVVRQMINQYLESKETASEDLIDEL